MYNEKGQQLYSRSKVYTLMLTGLMAAVVLAATSVFRIPVPATNGYVHLGDAMIFVAVLILGRRNGTIAGATGSALADLLGGYAHWVPWTFAIKGLMAFIFGTLLVLVISRDQYQNSVCGCMKGKFSSRQNHGAAGREEISLRKAANVELAGDCSKAAGAELAGDCSKAANVELAGDCSRSGDELSLDISTIVAMTLSSMIMIAGYFIAQRIIYGNLAAPLAALPGNIAQAAAGILIASVILAAIRRTAPQMLGDH